MKATPFQTYCLYLAVKSHFTQKRYDFFKYSGAVRATASSFDNRRDKYFFVRLAKKYDQDELVDFFVANIVKDKKWIGDFLEESSHNNYLNYLKYKQAFTYIFETELVRLLDTVTEPRDLFTAQAGSYPKIVEAYLGGKTNLETLAVLNRFVCFDTAFDDKLGHDDVIWSKLRQLIVKLHPFLQYDKKRILGVLKRHLNS
jgi:hypothetical protein